MSTITGVPRKPVMLVILDGFGINPSKKNNGIAEASTPNLDRYFSQYPMTTLRASGQDVGLPDGQMGNSEVGHLTLGSGSVIRQDVVKINDAIRCGDFFTNPVLLKLIEQAKQDEKRIVHLIGLVSDGGVHSHIDHLEALIKLCHDHNVKPQLHMITDGRDTPPQSALHTVAKIETQLHECGGSIASITGRYYAMDRDRRWDRTERAWRALMHGQGHKVNSAKSAIMSAYSAGDTDEFLQPMLLPTFSPISEHEPVFFFNFRKDRPRQLVAALAQKDFSGFDRGEAPLVNMTCLMPYDRSLALPCAFEQERPASTLGEVVSQLGLAQFRCAETEKYPHVTYFFNGGKSNPYPGESQALIPSPGVATYDQKPSMSAHEVADAVLKAISTGRYGLIVVNFANGDMVGHTARRDAVLEAVETLDDEASRILAAAETAGYSTIVTADHGNCELLVDPFTGEPHTQHTTYPVPCLIMDEENWHLSCDGGLANVAPTILELMGFEVPKTMRSSLLLKRLPGRRRVTEDWQETPETLAQRRA